MNLAFDYPMALWLLPIASLPLLLKSPGVLSYSRLELLPADRLSRWLAVAARCFAVLAFAALLIGLAGPFRPPLATEQIGRGAQMVLLLDRSSSMDRPFAGGERARYAAPGNYLSKGQLARQLLSEFADRRHQDMFGMLVFSTNPIQVLPLTDKSAMVQSAIEAGNSGRGLAKTNLGAGLIQALEFFADQPYTGSRIVLLVSDGGAKLGTPIQEKVESLMRRHRVALYWIYIRSANSPGLTADLDMHTAQQIAPEVVLHRFFDSLQLPYRAYSAENPEALQQAIKDVSRLQSLPIRYRELIPRRDLALTFYAIALVLVLLLVLFDRLELTTWRVSEA